MTVLLLSVALVAALTCALVACGLLVRDRRHDRSRRGADDALRRSVSSVRSSVGRLAVGAASGVDLETALLSCANAAAERSGLGIRVSVDPAATGPDDHLVVVLARELLMNAAEHSEGHHAQLRLDRAGSRVVLEVADDGVGTSERELERARAAGHLGLAIAAGRVDARGGAFQVSTAPHKGMRVRIELPRRRRTLRAA
jgi:two-component system NarL family sensor kinase